MKCDNFAVILARGGSKTIKDKNIKPLVDTNCVEMTIRSLLTILKSSNILLSSDSNRILDVGKNNDIRTLLRPKEYSTDIASSESAWIHSIEYLYAQNISPKTIIAPQVTCPLRYSDTFKKALKFFYEKKLDSLFSAVEISSHSFQWSLDENLNLKEPINYEPLKSRKMKQEHIGLKEIRENGSFFIFNTKGFLKNKNRLFGEIGYFLQDKLESIDIDDSYDWLIIESILKSNKNKFIY